MAALLRHGAARRLGGSVAQRAEAAVAEGRSRLGSRLRHTDELLRHGAARRLGDSVAQRAKAAVADRSSGLGSRLGRTDEHFREKVLREIQEKKEEVYDVIAKAEQSVFTSRFRNKLLLAHIAVQIKPRPEDFQWRRMHFARKALTMLETVCLISLAGTVVAGVVGYRRRLQEEEEEIQDQK